MEIIVYTTPPCIHCGKTSEFPMLQRDFERWRAGALAQDVWPQLTFDERELIMTGIHEECWDAMFREEDDE